MIFIKVDEDNRVTFVHYKPFDSKHGLNKSREELEQEGYFVDDIPDPEQRSGKDAILCFDPEKSILYYEYVDRPLTEKERLEQLEQAIIELTMIVAGGVS